MYDWLLLYIDGQLIVTLQEPIMAVDEGVSTFPVCVDFIGSNLNREAVVTLSTTQTGTALGEGSGGPAFLFTHSVVTAPFSIESCSVDVVALLLYCICLLNRECGLHD